MKHRVPLIQPRGAADRMPGLEELPFYTRDPAQVCATCHHLVRLRQHDTDTEGQLCCKWGPPNVTSVIDQTGRVAGLSQSFVPAHPLSWCFQWKPRQTNGGNMPPIAQ